MPTPQKKVEGQIQEVVRDGRVRCSCGADHPRESTEVYLVTVDHKGDVAWIFHQKCVAETLRDLLRGQLNHDATTTTSDSEIVVDICVGREGGPGATVTLALQQTPVTTKRRDFNPQLIDKYVRATVVLTNVCGEARREDIDVVAYLDQARIIEAVSSVGVDTGEMHMLQVLTIFAARSFVPCAGKYDASMKGFGAKPPDDEAGLSIEDKARIVVHAD